MTNQQNQQDQQQPRPQQNPQPQRERRAVETQTAPVDAPLTSSTPEAMIRAIVAVAASYALLRIAIDWSGFYTLVYAADISGFDGVVSWEAREEIPVVAWALAVVIFLGPALSLAYAALLTTPLLNARIAVVVSLSMSFYDILTTFLGYDVMEKVQDYAGKGEDGILVAVGILFTSIIASFADEAAIIAFGLGMRYANEVRKHWGVRNIWESTTATPTASAFSRIFSRGDGNN